MSFNKSIQLKLIVVFGVLLYLITAIKSDGFFHADEHFQIIEFADAKMGKFDESKLAWEYDAQLRPTIQPWIAFFMFEISETIGISDPYSQATILRILSALLALSSILFFIRSTIKSQRIKNDLLFVLFSLFIAFFPYINVRFSSETWAGLIFLFPLALVLKKPKTFNPFLVGISLGLSFLFRYQVGFMVLGLLLWLVFIQKSNIRALLKLLLALLLVTMFGIVIDSLFYGEFAFTCWNYFKVNILDGTASDFGKEPWYYYLSKTLRVFTLPFGILLIALSTVFFVLFRKHAITWVCVPFILVHFLIPHKEFRFLIPIINLIPIMLFVLVERHFSKEKTHSIPYLRTSFTILISLFFVSQLIIAYAFTQKAAGLGRIGVTKYIRSNYSTKTVNLINTKWASPYKPWGALIQHYNDENVTHSEVNSLGDIQASIAQQKEVNLIILRDIDLKNSPENQLFLKKNDVQVVYESMPPIVKWLGQNFGIFETENNLRLYIYK